MGRISQPGKWLVLAWLLAAACVPVYAQQPANDSDAIAFSAHVDQSEYPANAEFELSVVASWSGGLSDYALDRIEPPELDNLRILGSRTEAIKSVTGDRIDFKRTTVYQLRPEAQGSASIGPATAYYREAGADELKMMTSERIELTIGPPEYGLFEVRRNVRIALFALGLIVLAGLLFAVRAVVLKRARAKAEREAAAQPPPAEQYAEAMNEATAHLQSGDFAAFYRVIDTAVRRLAVRLAKLPTRSETTVDLAARLRSAGFDSPAIESIEILLRECENARYTGRTPTHSDASVFLARAKGLAETVTRGSARSTTAT